MAAWRKVVGIECPEGGPLIAVCNDGSVWSYLNAVHTHPQDCPKNHWQERCPVPGTKRFDELGYED